MKPVSSERHPAEAIVHYAVCHSDGTKITVSISGGADAVSSVAKSILRQLESGGAKAPAGYFNEFYTPELAIEDNAFAKHSVQFDPADFRE